MGMRWMDTYIYIYIYTHTHLSDVKEAVHALLALLLLGLLQTQDAALDAVLAEL